MSGFTIVRQRACMFNPFTELCKKLGLPTPLAIKPIVVLDWWLSSALRWNVHYWRDSLMKKLAPSSVFWILERQDH